MVDNFEELHAVESNMPNVFGAASRLTENYGGVNQPHPASLSMGNNEIAMFRKTLNLDK